MDDAELKKVIVQGCDALRIKIPEVLVDTILAEASGSVGLVQRLAEHLCRAEGINDSGPLLSSKPTIGNVDTWNEAKRAVAQQMEGRFETFADNFVRGMRRQRVWKSTNSCSKRPPMPVTKSSRRVSTRPPCCR